MDILPKFRDFPLPPHHPTPMKLLRKLIATFLRAEDGPTAVEYAIMAAAVIGVCILAITQLGATTNSVYTNSANKITAS